TLVDKANATHNNVRFGEDFYFILSLLAYAAKLIYMPKCYYLYHHNDGSLSDGSTPFDTLVQVVSDRKALFVHDVEAYRALNARIDRYRLDENKQKILWSFKKARYLTTIKLLLEQPVLLKEVPRFIWRRAYSAALRLPGVG